MSKEVFKDYLETHDLKKVQEYIDSLDDINQQDERGWSMLTYCCYKGYIDVIKILLNKGADVNGTNGVPPLVAAAAGYECLEAAKILLDSGAKINGQDPKTHSTALHQAAKIGDVKMLNLLLERDADITIRDNDGKTPLNAYDSDSSVVEGILYNYAAKHDVFVMLQSDTIININEDIPNRKDVVASILTYACRRGYCDVIHALLSREYDVEYGGADNPPLFITASKWCHVDVVKILLDYGANRNVQDIDGNSALHYAVSNKDIKMVEMLIEKKVNIYIKNHAYQTPLDICEENDGVISGVLYEHALNKTKDIPHNLAIFAMNEGGYGSESKVDGYDSESKVGGLGDDEFYPNII